MITLHRIGHGDELVVNCDMLVTVEATPDTVIQLATGARLVVSESPDEVAAAVRDWKAGVLRR